MQTKEGRKIEWETRHVRLKGSQREKNRVQCTRVKEREKEREKKGKKREKKKCFWRTEKKNRDERDKAS